MKAAIIAAGIVIAGFIIIYAVTIDEGLFPQDSTERLSGPIQIGVLAPITGDLADAGQDILEYAMVAEEDVNTYLSESGESWTINLIIEDTETNPDVALEKIKLLDSMEITAVVGPATSANTAAVKDYADDNGMLILSCCSSAPSLSIPDDNVYRIVPDNKYEGGVLASAIEERGIKVLIPVYRNDAWGNGLVESVSNTLSKSDVIVREGIQYNTESFDFASSAALLEEMVQDEIRHNDRSKVGVLLASFNEGADFLPHAAKYDVLDDILWFGSPGLMESLAVTDDPAKISFANSVVVIVVLPSMPENPTVQRVNGIMEERLGREPIQLMYVKYDAVWVMALAVQETQSTDTDELKRVIKQVAASYSGGTGKIVLNDAGDLSGVDYTVWGIVDGEQSRIGKYTASDGAIEIDLP